MDGGTKFELVNNLVYDFGSFGIVFSDSGTGGFVNDPTDVGGWPTLAGMNPVPDDTDNVGMADTWETKSFGSLTTGPNEDTDGKGDTNLKEYLHYLAAES